MQKIYNLRLVLIHPRFHFRGPSCSKGIRHPDNNEDHIKDDKRRDEERNASKTPTFERLQQHGPMPTKTIDQIRGCHRERGWNRQINMLENG